MPIHFPFGRSSNTDLVTAADCILPATTYSFAFDGTDLTEFVTDIQISGSRGGQVSGSVTLKDYTGLVAKLVSQFNQTNTEYRAHDMTAGAPVVLTLTQGANSVDYPDLIAGDPSWDNDATLTLTFTDHSPLINKDNQAIGDYLFTEGDVETSHTILADIAAIAAVSINPGFSAYDIGTFRGAKKNFTAAIDELAAPRQAYRKWNGSTLNLEILAETSPVDTIIDRFHIPEGGLSASLDTSNLRTFFRYFRDVPLSSSLCRRECTGGLLAESQCVGRVVELVFNRPTQHARVRYLASHGTIGEGVFFDEDENPLNVTPSTEFYGGPTSQAVRWLGTYTPEFGDEAYIPSWVAWADGGPISEIGGEGFESEKIIGSLEALYGRRPEFKDLESELLRNQTDAVAMLNAIALEVEWSVRKFTLSTPFLIPGREGNFVALTHHKHGLNSELCLIHRWSHNFSVENGSNHSYELRAKV